MKKYLCVASLFMFNAEVISWIALLIITFMGLIDFAKAVDREREKQKREREAE